MADLKVAMFVKVPKPLRCYQCEEDCHFTRQFPMRICSPQKWAETDNVVVWKCEKCGKSKAEKLEPGDGGRFYFEAKKMGLVLTS